MWLSILYKLVQQYRMSDTEEERIEKQLKLVVLGEENVGKVGIYVIETDQLVNQRNWRPV